MVYLGEKFAVQFNENLLADRKIIWREFHFPFKLFLIHIQREPCFGRKTKFTDRKFGIDERFDTEILKKKKSHGNRTVSELLNYTKEK